MQVLVGFSSSKAICSLEGDHTPTMERGRTTDPIPGRTHCGVLSVQSAGTRMDCVPHCSAHPWVDQGRGTWLLSSLRVDSSGRGGSAVLALDALVLILSLPSVHTQAFGVQCEDMEENLRSGFRKF